MLPESIPLLVDRCDIAWGFGVQSQIVKIGLCGLLFCTLQLASTFSTANAYGRADALETDAEWTGKKNHRPWYRRLACFDRRDGGATTILSADGLRLGFPRIDTCNAIGARSIFSAWGSLAQIDAAESNAAEIKDDPRIKRWRLTLMYGALLLIIFITAAAAIIVFSRRWRQWIRGGRKTGPTDATDVWAMHRDPEVDEDDSHDDEASR